MRRWRLLPLSVVAVIALVAPAGVEASAPPASGVIVEGRSVAGVALGTPISAVRRAWGLQCGGRLRPGDVQGTCTGIRRAAGKVYLTRVAYDQLGRVVEVTAGDPGWRTSRGIGPGSPLRRLRAVYGTRLSSRITRVWSYFEVDRRVGQDLYRTSFLGRTRFADVFTVTIHTVHETSLEVSRPTGGGLVVEVEGAWPLMDLPLEVRLPWTGRREPLGTVRVDRRGRATLTDPPGGAFDLILAGRPARTPSPVRVEVWAGWDTSSLVRVRRPIVASTLAPLPPAPTLTLTPEPVGVDGAATATVTGAEARASYVLVARWTCANGTPGESDLSAQLDPAGPGVLRAAVELRQVALERFDPACAGPAPAPTLGATLELRRFEARSRRQEVAAMAAVTLSAPR